MRTQATKANPAQIRHHIARQKRGTIGMEFAQAHPILDAIGGAALLAFFGWFVLRALVSAGVGV